ncbi:MAG: hypothetical protein KGH56_00935 [Patescibacteria group bacterium]|nr:hypothetical protein [Patescibacteria group bacterium]
MPSRKNNKPPPEVMTWTKAAPVLVVCFIFDALRFFSEMLWFFGPVLAAAFCAAKGAAIAGKVGAAKAGAAAGGLLCGAAGTALSLSSGFEAFGIGMSMAVGLFGWLIVLLMNALNNRDIFKENFSMLIKYGISLLISETPVINALPALTIVNATMFHVQIQKGKEALKKYEEENAARLKEQKRQAAELLRFRNEHAAQEEQDASSGEAFDQEQDESEAAKAETSRGVIPFPSERIRRPAAGEIPEELRKAA